MLLGIVLDKVRVARNLAPVEVVPEHRREASYVTMLGVSIRSAPIELLERLAFTDDDLAKAYRLAHDLDGLGGLVILSTCNRVEVYGSVTSHHAGSQALMGLLFEISGVGADELAEAAYTHWEGDAVEHLFEVAVGLDSMVLGDTQIHAQVRAALRRAKSEEAASAGLTGLFHAAARAGRRARQETSLGAAPDAYVALGADLADEALGGLTDREVLVIGAGEMAALAAKHLRQRGVGTMRILNRSVQHARSLAERTNAEHGDLGALSEAMESADLVVSATGSSEAVVREIAVRDAMAARRGRSLVLLDLAIPRNVEPSARDVPGARLIDLGTLRERLPVHREDIAADIARARAIVAQEAQRFAVAGRAGALTPLITALRSRGDGIVCAELNRYAAKLADLTPDERATVEALAHGIAGKLLHDPIVELKERSEPGTDGLHARVLAELLGVDPCITEEA